MSPMLVDFYFSLFVHLICSVTHDFTEFFLGDVANLFMRIHIVKLFETTLYASVGLTNSNAF